MRYGLLCVLLGLLAVLVLGCDAGSIAENEIEEAAPRYIGPADRYDAAVEGLGASRAEQVQLIGYGVRPEPNLELQQLTLTFRDVDYQRSPFRVTRVGNARFTVTATEQAVTSYLAERAQQATPVPIRDLRVNFLADQVQISGNAAVAGQEVPLTTTGTLQAQGARVLYQPQRITVEQIALGEQLRGVVAQVINPLIDLSRLRFAPQIESITLRPGTITVSGTGDVTPLLEE
jgi:hypothetical protein